MKLTFDLSKMYKATCAFMFSTVQWRHPKVASNNSRLKKWNLLATIFLRLTQIFRMGRQELCAFLQIRVLLKAEIPKHTQIQPTYFFFQIQKIIEENIIQNQFSSLKK